MRTLPCLTLLALSASCATTSDIPHHPAPLAPVIPMASAAPVNAPEHPTFNKDVAPILFKSCATCHRPGEVAPFPLLSYEDAAKRTEQIVRVTGNRFMPPWRPAHGYNEFQDQRSLVDAEIATLAAWAKAGAPRGDPGELPAPPTFIEGWQLGAPDLTIKIPQPFTVPAEGEDVYQCFVIPLGLAEDRSVAAMEFRPDNRRVVHHVIVYLDTQGTARKKDAASPEPGYRCFGGPGFVASGGLGGWVPGLVPRLLPDGVARQLPKEADLVVQLHYHPSGKVETDQSQLGIHFAKKPAPKMFQVFPLPKLDLEIPAGASRFKTSVAYTLPIDLEAVGVVPHMHLLGQEIKVTATLPDGAVKPLIYINDWDFNWQGEYTFKQSLRLPKGTRLELEAIYDNSDGNPNNPSHPPRKVTWGENTTDEMALAFIQYITDNPKDRDTLRKELVTQLQLWRFLPRLRGD